MTDFGKTPPVTIACNLAAIPADARDAHNATTQRLFASILEMRETADGYEFRLPVTSDALLQASAFIANERLCCPFIAFAIDVPAQQEGLWLRLGGVEGVKEFLRAEFVSHVPKTVAP